MLSMCKKIVLLIYITTFAIFCCADEKRAKGLFYASYGAKQFFSKTDVMKAYVGSWSGVQSIKFGDKKVGGRIDILYSPTIYDGALRIIGVGKVTSDSGHSVPIASYIYVQNSVLILEMRTAKGVASFYKGAFEANNVIWTPLYDFMTYDFQQDFFFKQDNVECINSVGARGFNYQGRLGFLEIQTQFKKLSSSKPTSKINTSVQKNINVQMGGGKFGR